MDPRVGAEPWPPVRQRLALGRRRGGLLRDDIPEAANAFGAAAADYERARPSYPREAIDVLRQVADLGPGRRVCDLAAGTGKLTRLLAAAGADVVAVEPVAGMRAQLEASVPGVEVLDGTAEAIPLPASAVDTVTVAQAFHWFRAGEALVEIARVLRPGGHLFIVFNERDERAPWVEEWNEAIGWHRSRVAQYQRTDWAAVMAGAGFFMGGEAHIGWNQPMTRELVAARVRSVSYVAAKPPAEQQEYVDRVLAAVGDREEPFDLPYVAHLWWASTPP